MEPSSVESLKCPECGATVIANSGKCEFCSATLLVPYTPEDPKPEPEPQPQPVSERGIPSENIVERAVGHISTVLSDEGEKQRNKLKVIGAVVGALVGFAWAARTGMGFFTSLVIGFFSASFGFMWLELTLAIGTASLVYWLYMIFRK